MPTAHRPTVSVALCTHNGAQFIAEQVQSILRQTEAPFEIVVSDDASTDDTLAVIEREVANHPAAVSLVVLRNSPALGVTANFEQAVRACSGDLIALCDQDDVWLPDRLEVMVSAFERDEQLALLFTDAQLVDEQGEPLRDSLFDSIGFVRSEQLEVRGGDAFATLLRRNVVTGATVVFRRSLLDAALPFPSSWVHDEWLAMVAAVTARLDFLDVKLVEYRQHSRNQIGARKSTLRDKVRKATEPRSVRNARLADRARALEAWARDRVLPTEVATAISAKARHEQRRSALPAVRLLRVGGVLSAALSRRYWRFGRGLNDVVRDLLQPGR